MIKWLKQTKPNIFVVEDDQSISKLIKIRLHRQYNCRIQTFPNVDSAINSIDELKPSLIISDILMPGKNGLFLQEALRHKNVNIPIIYLSAIKGHIDCPSNTILLHKPINFDKLFETIELITKSTELKKVA